MNLSSRDATIAIDGDSMPSYVCHPEGPGRALPAVIVVHEILGLTEHIRDVARRVAREGYIALAPDLFWNIGEPPDFTDRASFMRFRRQIDDRKILHSLDAAVDDLRHEPMVDSGRIGIVGFCMGGYYALLETVRNDGIAACADFYGGPLVLEEESEARPHSPLNAARDLRVPFLGLFGEEDQGIPVEHVQRLEKVLQGTGAPYDIKIYPNAGHAFHNDTGARYREAAAKDGWRKTVEFFGTHLKR